MPPQPALTLSRVEVQRSRQLIRDSRARIVSAKALIAQSRQALARQSYIRIVCAWCQQLMRWQRVQGAAWGQISHSICYDCFAQVFWELEPAPTPHPLPPGNSWRSPKSWLPSARVYALRRGDRSHGWSRPASRAPCAPSECASDTTHIQ